jgi:hypothetical protein
LLHHYYVLHLQVNDTANKTSWHKLFEVGSTKRRQLNISSSFVVAHSLVVISRNARALF